MCTRKSNPCPITLLQYTGGKNADPRAGIETRFVDDWNVVSRVDSILQLSVFQTALEGVDAADVKPWNLLQNDKNERKNLIMNSSCQELNTVLT